jgi:hypothetical protein
LLGVTPWRQCCAYASVVNSVQGAWIGDGAPGQGSVACHRRTPRPDMQAVTWSFTIMDTRSSTFKDSRP